MTPTPEYIKEFEEAMNDLESRDYFEVPDELHDRDFFSIKRMGADPDCNRLENTELFNQLMKEHYGDFLNPEMNTEHIFNCKAKDNFMSDVTRSFNSVDLIENDKLDKTCEEVREMISKDEQVNSPSHYQSKSGLEVIDVIEAFNLSFNIGNVLKYIVRADKKGRLIDLKKAAWYLQREIMLQEEANGD
jgi:hypothetical protein